MTPAQHIRLETDLLQKQISDLVAAFETRTGFRVLVVDVPKSKAYREQRPIGEIPSIEVTIEFEQCRQ